MVDLFFGLGADHVEAKNLLERALGGSFSRRDSEAYDDTIAYSADLLGLEFTLYDMDKDWPEGHLFHLIGRPIRHRDTENTTNLDFHIAALLHAQKVTFILDREEFNIQHRKRRQPEPR